MRLRLVAALAAATLTAGLAPAQTVFYPAATAVGGTQAGVVYDVPTGGFLAAVRDPLGVVDVLPAVEGLSVQSVYVISPNGRYVGGTAAGWGWSGNVYSYHTYPVVWDADTGDVRVIPVPVLLVKFVGFVPGEPVTAPSKRGLRSVLVRASSRSRPLSRRVTGS